MRRLRAGLFFIGALLLTCGVADRVLGQGTGIAGGSQQGDRHNPFSPNYADFSRGYSQDQFARTQGRANSMSARPILISRPQPVFGGATFVRYPFGGYPFFYGVYSDYPYTIYPYTIETDSGQFGPYVASPVIVSGDAQFGPQAVQRFMGVDPVPRPAEQPAARPRRGLDADAAPVVPRADGRARVKAWHAIDQGDAEFAQRRFAQALTRYRDAAAAARDLAEAQFRQGFALMAAARFAQAAKAFRHGLDLDPDWADSDFHLDDLYGENKAVKASHLDALQKEVAGHPHDPELLFVLGVCLYFDGQTDAAAPLFRRAAHVLGPLDSDHLAGFLKHVPPEKKAAQQNAPAPNVAANNSPAKDIAAKDIAAKDIAAKDIAAKNAAENKPAQGIPPPPLPAADNPASKNPPAKPAEKPFDPFEGLDLPK